MAARAKKKKFLAKRFAHAISVHYRDFEHAYVYWIWLRGSASYVIITLEVNGMNLKRRSLGLNETFCAHQKAETARKYLAAAK